MFKKLLSLALVLAGSAVAFAQSAYAAADPIIASTTETMVTSLTENLTSVITSNITEIVVVGVLVFSIGFLWRLFRRFVK